MWIQSVYIQNACCHFLSVQFRLFNQDGNHQQDILVRPYKRSLCRPARCPAPSSAVHFGGNRWCSAPAETGLACGRISVSVLSHLSPKLFSFSLQKTQISVAWGHCIPLSEKLCNYCDLFQLIYFLLECVACDSETLGLFYNRNRLPVALKLEYSA